MSYCILKQHSRKLSQELPEGGRCYSVEQYLASADRCRYIWMHYNDIEDYDISLDIRHELHRRISADGGRLTFFTTEDVGKPGRFLDRRVWVHARSVMLRFLERPDAIPAVALWDALAILCESFLLTLTMEEWEDVSRSARLRRTWVREFRKRLGPNTDASPAPGAAERAELRRALSQPEWWREVIDPNGSLGPEAILDQLERAVGFRGMKKAMGRLVPAIYADLPLSAEEVAVAFLWITLLRGH